MEHHGTRCVHSRTKEEPLATGDNARKGAVRKRSQLKTKMQGEQQWTKRSRTSGRFMDVKKSAKKFKGVRRERSA